VEESAEAISTFDASWRCGRESERWQRRIRRCETEGAVRTVAVVVVDEDTEHTLEVTLVEDQEPVDALRADGADELLSDRIRRRSADRRPDDLYAFALEHGVEVTRERAVAVADGAGVDRSLGVQANCRACWMTHSPLGFAVQPARCTRRLPSSMKKSTYSRCSRTVSTVKKSTASMLCACARKN
jgi:hypothetical protein